MLMKKMFTLIAVLAAAASSYAQTNAWGLQGSGTESDPYQISSADDFTKIANAISSDNKGTGEYFEVTADINFGGTADAPVQLPAIGKSAITNISSVAWGFNGTLDGDNHTITGIYHTSNTNSTEGKFNGLFASIDEQGVVKNLNFGADNYINSYNYVGTIASISKGTIENCTNAAAITATGAFAGGICGSLITGKGTIKDCKNTGNIKANTYATGIVACCQSGNATYAYLVENCNNSGNISTTNGAGSAGIAGSFSGTIKNCTNTGTIDDSEGNAKSVQYTAGIVSCPTYLVAIEGCINEGEVKGGKSVGGIIGQLMKGDDSAITVSGCTNKGAVSATGNNVGGIVGNTGRTAGKVTIAGCTNEGTVSSTGTTELLGNLRGSKSITLGEGNTISSSLSALPLDTDTDGISTITTGDTLTGSYKTIIDGRLVIVNGGKRYNAAGAQIR